MKILVGYNDSKATEAVLKSAHKHALSFKADVFIMTSMEQSPTLKKEEIDKVESKLEKIKKRFKADDLPCKTHASVSYETPGEDLIRFAKENDIDEIIIGIKKTSKVGKLMFGSTAQYVILKAPCPVLAVK